MKALSLLPAALVLAAVAFPAAAQDTETRNTIEVFKSRAEVINAEAQNKQANAAIINAQAVYMKSHAESQKLHQETREKSAQNDLLETKVFYDKRGLYHAYKEAHKAKASTPEQLASRAAQAAPGRMSSTQLFAKPGYVRWPSMLRHADYAEQRAQIDALFAQRTPDDSGAGSQNCVDLQTQIEGMKAVLVGKVRHYKSSDYLVAKKFLDALAMEAQFAVDSHGQLASR